MKKSIWFFIAILTLSAIVRIIGIWHGYPYTFYPDEAHFVKRALAFGSFDFNPHWFHKPAFYMYVLFFEYGIYFMISKVFGLVTSVADFAVSYIRNPGPFYIIGRLTTAIFGCATVVIVYLAGERHFRKNSGLYAALLLSLSFGHVVASQDIKADVPSALFAILSMYYLLNYISAGTNRNIILAGLVAGVGAATKIYPIVMLVPVFMAIAIMTWGKKDTFSRGISRAMFLSCAALIVFWGTYFICAPYSFIDPAGRAITFGNFIGLFEKVRHLIVDKTNVAHVSASVFVPNGTGFSYKIISYIKVLFQNDGLGMVIACTSFIGVVYLLLLGEKKNYIFLLFPLTFMFVSVYAYPGIPDPRHQLPIYPFLAIAGGSVISWLVGDNRRQLVVCTLLLGFLIMPLYYIIQHGVYVSKTDTRNLAKVWIESHVPGGTKLLMDENGPILLSSENSIREQLQKAISADPNGQFTANYDTYLEYQLLAAEDAITYDITEIRFPWWHKTFEDEGVRELKSDFDRDMGNPLKPVGVRSYDYYVNDGYKYAIVQSGKYKRFLRPGSDKVEKFPGFANFYFELFTKGTLVKEFLPTDGNRPGPEIKIFKFSNTSGPGASTGSS